MSFHDASSTIGVRNVVSSTSSRLMPSMPTKWWMPSPASTRVLDELVAGRASARSRREPEREHERERDVGEPARAPGAVGPARAPSARATIGASSGRPTASGRKVTESDSSWRPHRIAAHQQVARRSRGAEQHRRRGSASASARLEVAVSSRDASRARAARPFTTRRRSGRASMPRNSTPSESARAAARSPRRRARRRSTCSRATRQQAASAARICDVRATPGSAPCRGPATATRRARQPRPRSRRRRSAAGSADGEYPSAACAARRQTTREEVREAVAEADAEPIAVTCGEPADQAADHRAAPSTTSGTMVIDGRRLVDVARRVVVARHSPRRPGSRAGTCRRR